jgi:enoyl-CoA hydratase/carnithine racemase
MLTGRRYGGTEAQVAGVVDRAVPEDAVRGAALEIAHAHTTKAGDTLGAIKARMYGPILAQLRDAANPFG